ncbi:GNAT family N-acetyltransferase [Micromonospora sp. NPDC050397]|uniref:GNAT family N-acetyltransferase n=1 Tax=Micromonospora sp. NPDC050397 TaxID=3364279 RepID=UPI00384BF3B2
MGPFELETWDSSTVVLRLAELTSIYLAVYAEPPYNSGSLWSADAFADRTRRQATHPGFSFVVARRGEKVLGFSFGLPFAAGRWWSGEASDPPEHILHAEKFAVIELVLLKEWRGLGIGHQMHDRLLAGRNEAYAVLTAMPTAHARQMYQRWGWHQVGTARHTPDSPLLDALVLPLPKSA